MKYLVSLAVIALLVGGGFFVYKSAGARGDVAKQKVLSTIDKWLGESDVQRAEIERGIKALDKAIVTLSDACIKAQVQAEMLDKELQSNKKITDKSKTDLVKLKSDLSAFDSDPAYYVSYGTKTYRKKEDLEKMARKVIDNYTSLSAQTESMEKRLQTYEMTAKTLLNRETGAKNELTDMRNRLRELDAKIEMVKAQKLAAEALSETDKTFADSVAGIKEKIKDLDLKTEVAVRKEKQSWDELTAKTEVEDASKIINNSKNLVSEIDALLGNK